MQEKLIIYLHSQDLERPSWALVSLNGSVSQQSSYDLSEKLHGLAQEKEVIVIVPAEDVLLTTVQLPNMKRSQLAKAVPYALEEQLIDEVDTLHFAIGDDQVNGDLAVAVVTHQKMQQWLALLKSWNVQADVFVPASLALPLVPNEWHVAMTHMAIVRTGALQGFACDKMNFAELMDIALAKTSIPPQLIAIQHYSNDAVNLSLDELITIKENRVDSSQLCTEMARNLAHTPCINLLQGSYAVKKSILPHMSKIWKVASYAAMAWIFLLFFYPTVSYFILKSRVSDMDEQIAQIYKRNFPKASSIVAPKLRMEEKMQKLMGEIGENRLLLLLGYVGKGMQATPGIKLKRLDFQNNQLTLELNAATSEDFSAFSDYLSGQGFSVKQQNANLAGSRINATLLVE